MVLFYIQNTDEIVNDNNQTSYIFAFYVRAVV